MKILSFLSKGVSLLLFLVAFGRITSYAQTDNADKKTQKQEMIRGWVESQEYDFRPQTAMPLGGRTRELTTDFDLKVTKETVVSYLPYFGQAYTAPMDPSQGGLQFTSKEFDYSVTNRKKGGWDVQIKPKDNREVQQMSMTISVDGYASLQVISTNRQPISFNGYIMAANPKQEAAMNPKQ